jgi:DNA-binding NarL/FixJ family response regulator
MLRKLRKIPASKIHFRLAAGINPRSDSIVLMKSHPTPRQSQILRLIARGFTDKEIGSRLAISESTVTTHVQRAMARFRARSRTQAVVRFLRA